MVQRSLAPLRPQRPPAPRARAPLRRGLGSVRGLRRGLQQLAELLLPPLRLAGGAVPSGLGAPGNQEEAPVLHAPDLALEHAELWRIALIVGGVDREQHRLDALEPGGGVVVARRVPLIEDIVGIAGER